MTMCNMKGVTCSDTATDNYHLFPFSLTEHVSAHCFGFMASKLTSMIDSNSCPRRRFPLKMKIMLCRHKHSVCSMSELRLLGLATNCLYSIYSDASTVCSTVYGLLTLRATADAIL